jgi:hypothetical protein
MMEINVEVGKNIGQTVPECSDVTKAAGLVY